MEEWSQKAKLHLSLLYERDNLIAFQWSALEPELQKRIQTAVLGVAAILLVLGFGGHFGASLFAVVIALGMVYEFSNLILVLEDQAIKRQVLLGATWLVAFVSFWQPRVEYELLILSFIGVFLFFLFSARAHHGEAFQQHFRELIASVFGLFYLGFLPLYLPLIRGGANGLHWTFLFLLVVWSTDVGGYFAGKRYGRRKLYPEISPKKTYEGAAGGILLAVLVSLIYKLVFFSALGWFTAVIVPVFVSAVSQLGDLCESFIKRAFNAKDSGSILPGHGGFLDRFDGVVFSLPVMYLCIRLFS